MRGFMIKDSSDRNVFKEGQLGETGMKITRRSKWRKVKRVGRQNKTGENQHC